jgi:uncharacterized protein YwlG (UPF0340 family)
MCYIKPLGSAVRASCLNSLCFLRKPVLVHKVTFGSAGTDSGHVLISGHLNKASVCMHTCKPPERFRLGISSQIICTELTRLTRVTQLLVEA